MKWRSVRWLTSALAAIAVVGVVPGVASARAAVAPDARPQGGTVVGGAASIAQTATATNITVTSSPAVINWTSFDVGSHHTVTISGGPALMRSTGPDATAIAGHVTADKAI